MLTLVLPVTVILGKVLLLLPCFGRKLHRIRRGWQASQTRKDPPRSANHLSPERVTIM